MLVVNAFQTAPFCNHRGMSLASCLKRIKARGALNTFHSSWTRLMPSPSTFLPLWCPCRCPIKPMRWNMLLGRAKSELASYTKSPPPNECLFCFVKTIGIKKDVVGHFKRAAMKAKHANEFRPNDVMWEKTSKGLLRNADRLLKNTDKRMVYIYNNIIFAKKDFTFGLRTVKSGEIHLIQTSHVPLLIYELPASSLKCRAQRNVIRRSFEPYDQMLYHRTILEPHTAYPILAGTNYIVLMVQKAAFGLDIIPESLLSQLIQKGFHVGDFRKMKKFDQTPYKLPPPTPIHVPAERRPLEEKSLPFSKKRFKVRITNVMRRVSRRLELPMAPVQIPHVLEPVQIPQVPQPPVQIPDVLEPVQIALVPQSPVQIPVSHVLEPPVQIPVSHVSEPPVQISVSQVPQSPVQISVSQFPQSPVQIPVSPVQIPVSPVQIPVSPVQIPDVPEYVQIPVSQVSQPPMQILHVPEPPVQILHISEPMQIPVSQVPLSPVQILPEPMQILPELDILDPLESTDAFDQLMSFVFGPQELQLLHRVPSIFDGNLLSFLDEFEGRLWT
ncbi:uncharacterized protein TNCV_4059341 [Trichonephila clavipes]|nr:uncharacterized protein TNCV_4059341 [Trichonephila clavipes]